MRELALSVATVALHGQAQQRTASQSALARVPLTIMEVK